MTKFEGCITLGDILNDLDRGAEHIILHEFIGKECKLNIYHSDPEGNRIDKLLFSVLCSIPLSKMISRYIVLKNGELVDDDNHPVDDLKDYVILKINREKRGHIIRLSTLKNLPKVIEFEKFQTSFENERELLEKTLLWILPSDCNIRASIVARAKKTDEIDDETCKVCDKRICTCSVTPDHYFHSTDNWWDDIENPYADAGGFSPNDD